MYLQLYSKKEHRVLMNLTLLHRKFNTQDKCIAYLKKLRWGNTPACIHCGSMNVVYLRNSICSLMKAISEFSIGKKSFLSWYLSYSSLSRFGRKSQCSILLIGCGSKSYNVPYKGSELLNRMSLILWFIQLLKTNNLSIYEM